MLVAKNSLRRNLKEEERGFSSFSLFLAYCSDQAYAYRYNFENISKFWTIFRPSGFLWIFKKKKTFVLFITIWLNFTIYVIFYEQFNERNSFYERFHEI